MEKNEFIAMSAAMEGNATVMRNIGKKIELSELELIVLCNLAQLGIFYHFSSTLKGRMQRESAEELADVLEGIVREFSLHGGDGLNRIMQAGAAALLADDRLKKYLFAPSR